MGTRPPRKHHLRILTVSDIIDNALIQKIEDKTLGQVDLIFSCGDLSPEYISMLKGRVDAPLYYVKGNHDIRYRPDNTMGCENIHGRVITVGSLNILGLEGSMWYNGGPNQYTESDMKKIIFVGAKVETPIIDQLYALDEIQEVHSVHGNIDILAKMTLKRDFLVSDAETIAEFVDDNIRPIEGIDRTQTLIPGISKVKPLFNA